ncbi:MAG: hypothetical protein MUP47_10925 [Phycisphaerae bacterium]|nr:hypothetical protein [Phycisphaerae bacterium]
MDENTPRDARCEESDDTLWGMMRMFFSRAMLPMVLLFYFWAIVFIAGAVYCGVRFFRSDETRLQIAFAAGFICFVHAIGLMKVFGWQLIHKRSLSLKIKRLEARVAECIQACKR